MGSIFQPIFIPSSSEIDLRPQPFASHSYVRGGPQQKGETHKVVMKPHCKSISFSSRGLAGRVVQKKKLAEICHTHSTFIRRISLPGFHFLDLSTLLLCLNICVNVTNVCLGFFVNHSKLDLVCQAWTHWESDS